MIWKIKVFMLRLLEFILRWPYRFFQLVLWLFFIHPPVGKFVMVRWFVGLVLKTIDLTPIPLVIETFLDIFKWNTRGMTASEKKIASFVFQKKINYSLVGLDDNSFPVKKGKAQAYVTLHTVNFFQSLPDHILIHELTHIWQYRKHGSIYITEALYAQRWGGGYDYGGTDALAKNKDKGLMAFNFEQQAEIVEDGFRGNFQGIYQDYINEIRNG